MIKMFKSDNTYSLDELKNKYPYAFIDSKPNQLPCEIYKLHNGISKWVSIGYQELDSKMKYAIVETKKAVYAYCNKKNPDTTYRYLLYK